MDVYTCRSAVSILMFLYYLVARSKQIRAQNYNTATFVWLLRVKLLTSISILVAANACEMSTDTTFAFDLLIIILLFYQTLDFSQSLEEGFAWVACRGTWSLMAVHDLLAISELALLPHPSMLVPACILLGICQFCISLTLSVLLLSSRSLQPAATTPDEIGHPITNKIRAAGGHWQWIKQFRLFLSWTYPEGPVEWTCVVASIALTVLEALLETWLPDIGVDAFDKHQQNRLSLLNLHAFITFLACDGAIYFVHTCFWTAQNVHRSFRAQQKINRRLMDVEEACLNQHSPRELKDTHRVSSVIPTMLDFLPLRVIPQVIKLVHVTSYLLRHYGSRVTLILLASAVLHTMAQYHAAQTDYSNSNAFDEVTGQWKVHQDDMIEGRSTIRLHGSADSMLGELDAFALKRIQIQATNNNFFRRTGAQSGLFKFISGIIAINLLADREGPMLYLQILNGHLHNLVLTLLGLPHDISVRLTQIETARIVMNTPSEMQFGTKKLQRGPGRIEFVNVSFDHIRGGEVIPVFKDLSLAIEAGSTTAFVGESGIGKSTLLKLLTREANPKSGSITIDGQDIQALKQYELSRHITIMEQEPFIFNKSILENIRLGNPLASLEQVQVAARSAAIFEEINSMPNQFDTQVEHNGRRFSGGQRQRLALARAFLSSGSLIYCWDEHTRSLDTTTENHVRKNIGSLCDNKTSIVTTHRLSTIVDAAMIYHLGKEGPYTIVMEMGTHTELLEKGGVYAKMWNNSSNSPLQAAPV